MSLRRSSQGGKSCSHIGLEVLESRQLLSVSVGGTVLKAVPSPTVPPIIVSTPVIGVPLTIQAEATEAFHGEVAGLLGFKGTLSQLSATINWGDGTPATQAVLQFGPAGGVQIIGDHTYAAAGKFNVDVTVTRQIGPPGSLTPVVLVSEIKSHAVVTADVDGGVTITEPVGWVFTAALGSFDYVNPSASPVATRLIATIDWGDGRKTPGTVRLGAAGDWDVVGTHEYTKIGDYTVHVVVTSLSPTATATPPVVVAKFISEIKALAVPTLLTAAVV